MSDTRSAKHAPGRVRKGRLVALAAVLGPGLLAGLSDDDPAGITTYSVLGADYGYQLLWVLLVSTIALVVFHSLGARMGVVTGQGLIGLIRQRYGVRFGVLALVVLVLANVGTTCAEFAGIAAGFQLFGVERLSVPVAAAVVTRPCAARQLPSRRAHPDGPGDGLRRLRRRRDPRPPRLGRRRARAGRPTPRSTRVAVFIATATVGTTLAPWGLSFIQSYAVDKRLTTRRPRVSSGSTSSPAPCSPASSGSSWCSPARARCTRRGSDRLREGRRRRARSRSPAAWPARLFAVGLIGAALLAAAILPLSTAYSVCEFAGSESALDDDFADARLFYVTYVAVMTIGAASCSSRGRPSSRSWSSRRCSTPCCCCRCWSSCTASQATVTLMGDYAATRATTAAHVSVIVLVTACVIALVVIGVSG